MGGIWLIAPQACTGLSWVATKTMGTRVIDGRIWRSHFFGQTFWRANVQLTMSQNDPGNQGRSEEDADDVRLMALVGRGDTQAFEQLIEKHQALVAGTIAR